LLSNTYSLFLPFCLPFFFYFLTSSLASPYAALTNLGFLERSDGYIVGVTNPIFATRSEWWSVCADVATGTVTESPAYRRQLLTRCDAETLESSYTDVYSDYQGEGDTAAAAGVDVDVDADAAVPSAAAASAVATALADGRRLCGTRVRSRRVDRVKIDVEVDVDSDGLTAFDRRFFKKLHIGVLTRRCMRVLTHTRTAKLLDARARSFSLLSFIVTHCNSPFFAVGYDEL
jgi:hypothetical protein